MKVFLSFIMLIFFSVFLGMVTVLKLVGWLPYLSTTFNHPGSAASKLVCSPGKPHLVLSTDLLGLPDKSLLCSSQPSGVSRLQIFVFTVLPVALWLRFSSFALGIWNLARGKANPVLDPRSPRHARAPACVCRMKEAAEAGIASAGRVSPSCGISEFHCLKLLQGVDFHSLSSFSRFVLFFSF